MSIQAVNLSNSKPPHIASNRACPPAVCASATISNQISPQVPSRTPESNDRRIFYGFEVSIPWLVEFCEKHADIIKNYDPNWYSASKVHIALTLLRVLSGIQGLRAEHVLFQVNQPHIRLGGKKGYTPFVAICSSMKSSWDRRPSDGHG